MTAHRHHPRVLAALTALMLLVACGGSDDSDASADAGNAAGEDASPEDDSSAEDDAAAEDDSGDDAAFGAEPSDILDAEYSQGTSHVEVSGESDLTADYSTGGGFTDQGMTSLSFTGDNNGLLGILIDPSSGGGISFSDGDFATGGSIPNQCRIGVTQNDASGFAGNFACEGVPAVEGLSGERTVDVVGSFSVRP